MTARLSDLAVRAPTRDDSSGTLRPRRGQHKVDPVRWWLKIVGCVVVLYLILPTLFVIPMSFGADAAFNFPPKRFSLRLYKNFFTDPVWLDSLRNSLLVAALAALLATVVGTSAAIGLFHLTGRLPRAART